MQSADLSLKHHTSPGWERRFRDDGNGCKTHRYDARVGVSGRDQMKKENTSMTMKDPCHSDILKQQGWLSDGVAEQLLSHRLHVR
jgi:hypothetical protein